MSDVLIIDDEQMLCDVLKRRVELLGHDVAYALNLSDGMRLLGKRRFDVVFLDVRLPDGNGLDAISEIKGSLSEPEVIIFTGEGDPDGAELAIRNGAWDYIEKPSSLDRMTLPLIRALQYRQEKTHRGERIALKLPGIRGDGPAMKTAFDLLAQAASGDANVLVYGETGTGKELFSRAIHENSRRWDRNFVVVDCAALPETLVESVLFGHIKGAFTGAVASQEGLIKQADGGTLFLDEVGELPVMVQKAFLRVLQEHRFRQVGGKQEVQSDFRLVAATNRNLDEMVRAGRFRKDLLFRIKGLAIHLPALRKHPEDIRAIARYHVSRLCERYQIGTKGFSPEFFEALEGYDWPGNVRELVSTMETALAASRHDPTLFAYHLPINIRVRSIRASVAKKPDKEEEKPESPESGNAPPNAPPPSFRDVMDATEKQYFRELMAYTKGDIQESCGLSGLSRSRLYAILKKHDLSRKAE